VNLYGYAGAGGDVHLCTGPLYHAAPLAFSMSIPLAFGATVVVIGRLDARARPAGSSDEHKGDRTRTWSRRCSIGSSRCRGSTRAYDVSSVRHVLHGAAPCPVP